MRFRRSKLNRHEKSSFSFEIFAKAVLVVILVALLIHLVLWIFHVFLAQQRAPFPASPEQTSQSFPTPRLQASPPEDLRKHYGKELKHLNEYGWIDRNNGRVHVPVSVAMEKYLEDQQKKEKKNEQKEEEP